MVKYWEILQLQDGSFVLQNSEEDDKPLVRIEFSGEAEQMFGDLIPDVARAMISSGMDAAGFLSDGNQDDVDPAQDNVIH